VIFTELASRTHIKRRHYAEENIQPDVRYKLEQQRRRQKDEDKWKSMYKILFPGEVVPSPCMHLQPSPYLLLMLSVVFTNPSSAVQNDSNDVSQPSRIYLPTAPEVSTLSNSTSTEPNGRQGNIIAAEPMQGIQETGSTSDVPPIVTNDFSHDNPGFFDHDFSYAELDEASRDTLNSWSPLWHWQ
jgi:hypothetical protein